MPETTEPVLLALLALLFIAVGAVHSRRARMLNDLRKSAVRRSASLGNHPRAS